jgi:Patatin-like phospholipase
MIWAEFLNEYQAATVPLFSESLLRNWGNEPWAPNDDDRKAAGKLHTQLTSRIATQRLGYLEGEEQTALESLYALFQTTRDIVDEFPSCRHFDALAWDVLNDRVRPFTAKWHRESERGMLAALDATDEFRAQLADLQPVLRRFDELLLHLRDNQAPPKSAGESSDRQRAISEEMNAELAWGMQPQYCGIEAETAKRINRSEREAINQRRMHYGIDQNKPHAIALCLSGGGIRSATFSLGVLVALAKRGVLPQVDYLSTVSGGGYLGSFLSAFLNFRGGEGIGLGAHDLPFQREAGEAAALRHIRHHSKYLATGSLWQRVKMICAQLYGMVLNGLAIIFLIAVAAMFEGWLRAIPCQEEVLRFATGLSVGALLLGLVGALVALRFRGGWHQHADTLVAVPAVLLVTVLCWGGLKDLHAWYHNNWDPGWTWSLWGRKTWLAIAGAIPIITSALSGAIGRFLLKRAGIFLVVLSAIAAPLFLFGVYLGIYEWLDNSTVALPFLGTFPQLEVELAILFLGGVVYLCLLNINFTSPHRHYRDKLAEAYLIQPSDPPSDVRPFEQAGSIRLSDLGQKSHRAPYHLLNCALNVPSSKNQAMQGRLTDFFMFSAKYCGSPLTGYQPTESWENLDPHLNLGTAMAISGGAAAPQMGLMTMKRLSFWLALLNIRLAYWLRKPGTNPWLSGAPGLGCLLREMLGTSDETLPWLNISDGGHIENLGVYELLRRRCKYIIAIDGEQDPKMTFHGLTTLQRLAAIDFGVRIDIDLDDLRLNTQGLSRSHFRFCRIRYPKEGRESEDLFGYLLYVKLSLTGNEGEFIRRYRLDEPVFPHHSTADQFFSEAQFEAYRSLGEHVGDKLFLRSIIGDLAGAKSIHIEEWFREIGKNLLEPRRPA